MPTVVTDRSRDTEHFPMRVTCARCNSDLDVELSDLPYDKWKVSGYWFAGTEQIEAKYTFECPPCNTRANGNEVDASLIPLVVRKELQADYEQRKNRPGSIAI